MNSEAEVRLDASRSLITPLGLGGDFRGCRMWHSSGVQSDQSQDETASVPIGSSVTRGSISKLPPELILTILESTWDSTCFTNYDPSPGSSFRARTQILSRCSLVCKTWTEPAQSLLWSRIELDRRRLDVLSGMKPLEHDDDNGRFALRYPVMHIGLQWPLFGSNSDSSSRRTVDEEEERARPWVQRDIDRCAVLFANVQYSLRGLRIEVNSAVEGSQAVLQVLSFDSLRGKAPDWNGPLAPDPETTWSDSDSSLDLKRRSQRTLIRSPRSRQDSR